MSRHDGPLWHGLTFLSTSRDFAESYAGPSGTISSWRMPDWNMLERVPADVEYGPVQAGLYFNGTGV